MGVWGAGIFDCDAAYDSADELDADPRGFFVEAFEVARTAMHVGDDACQAALVG